MMKILPSLPPNAFKNLLPSFAIQCGLRDFADLVLYFIDIAEKAEVYIRHKPTVDLLAKYLKNMELKSEEASIENAEAFYVISLKTRAPVSGQDVEVKPEDLLILRCVAVKGSWV